MRACFRFHLQGLVLDAFRVVLEIAEMFSSCFKMIVGSHNFECVCLVDFAFFWLWPLQCFFYSLLVLSCPLFSASFPQLLSAATIDNRLTNNYFNFAPTKDMLQMCKEVSPCDGTSSGFTLDLRGSLQVCGLCNVAIWPGLWGLQGIIDAGIRSRDTRSLCKLVSVRRACYMATWSKLCWLHTDGHCKPKCWPSVLVLLPVRRNCCMAIQSRLPSMQASDIDTDRRRLQGLLSVWAFKCVAVWCQLRWLQCHCGPAARWFAQWWEKTLEQQPGIICLHVQAVCRCLQVRVVLSACFYWRLLMQVCQDHCIYMGSVLWQYDPQCQGCKPSLLPTRGCKSYCCLGHCLYVFLRYRTRPILRFCGWLLSLFKISRLNLAAWSLWFEHFRCSVFARR